jgi:hypothetical protein
MAKGRSLNLSIDFKQLNGDKIIVIIIFENNYYFINMIYVYYLQYWLNAVDLFNIFKVTFVKKSYFRILIITYSTFWFVVFKRAYLVENWNMESKEA